MHCHSQCFLRFACVVGLVLFCAGGNAQTAGSTPYTITTLAGGGVLNDISALSVGLTSVPFGDPLAADAAGNIYVASGVDSRVYKIDINGVLTLVAGNGTSGDSGDGGSAINAQLGGVAGVAVDSAGNVYIAELQGSRVRKVSNGLITTVAGNGQQGYSGDNGPATSATLNQAFGVAVDSAGNLYIADGGNRIRKVVNGIITTIAGNGTPGFSGDNGPATSAQLYIPNSVQVDSSGNVYIADTGNARVRKVSNGTITTVAGNGTVGFSGDNGPATNAQIGVLEIALDTTGSLYLAGAYDTRIRQVTNGIITTIAGNGVRAYAGDGGFALNASLAGVTGIAVDSQGAIYASTEDDARIRRISNGLITTFGGGGNGGDGGSAGEAFLNEPRAVAVDSAGNVYIADFYFQRVRKVSNGIITTIAGNGAAGYSGDGGPAIAASLNYPLGVAVDSAGSVYIVDVSNYRIRKVSNGIITTVAGNGNPSYSGDGGLAVNAGVDPFAIAIDAAGTLYIADGSASRIRKVVNGVITTIAGNGTFGFSGDNGPAVNAEIDNVFAVAADNSGNVYIADTTNSRIRKISNGIITTIVGNSSSPGTYSGDGGPALMAGLIDPDGVAVDASGNLYISDSGRIRKVANGIITTIAGTGNLGFSGDGGPATLAALSSGGLAVDAQGSVYIADSANNRVRIAVPAGLTAAPNLLALSPSSGVVGGSGFTLSIGGTGFSVGNVVLWNGSPILTTFISSTKLNATVSASLLSAAGASSVSVGSSNVLNFATVAPILNNVSPGSIGPGASAFTITVAGSNFVNSSTIHFDGTTLATTFVNSTTLSAVVPASLVAVPRSALVSVFTYNTSSNEFTFIVGTPPLTCNVNGGVPPILRFEGVTELAGDLVLNCTGGISSQPITTDVTIFANVNLTSRIVNSSANLTEAILLVNDPQPSQQTSANVISGFLTGENAITFKNVQITPPGNGNLTLRIVNLRTDVHQFGPQPPGSPAIAYVYVGASKIPITNGIQAVGFVLPTDFQNLSVTSTNNQRNLQVSFTEGFATAFKIRVDPSGNQNIPGMVYNTESGFVNTALAPGAGLADNGTRLLLRLTNVPSGVSVYASVSPTSVAPAGDSAIAKLVSTDGNGAGPTSFISGSSLFGGTYAQIPVSNGTAMAVWEVTAANSSVLETLNFQIVLTGMTQAGLGPISTFGSLAPFSTFMSASASAPLPGFAPDSLSNFVNMTLVAGASLGGKAKGPSGDRKHPTDTTGPVQVGSNLPFSFDLLNQGPGPASQVTVSSNLPPALAYIANSCQVSSGTTAGICLPPMTNSDGSTTITGQYPASVQPGGAPQFSFNVQPGQGTSIGATGNVVTTVTSSLTDSYPPDNTLVTPFVISGSALSSSSYDINGDGKQDLAVYYSGTPGYEYSLMSAGNGTFTAVGTSGINSGGGTFDTVLQADFNGDSKSDILFYSSSTGALKVGLGDGTGKFTYAPVITISTGYNVLARGDFNKDGKADLLLYRQSDGAASVALSNGDGTFTFIGQTFNAGFTSVAVADYNGDGISDVILYNNQTSPYNAYYLVGDGTGHFPTGSGLFFGGGFTVYPADLNADGKSDFILYRPSDGTVFVAISNGTGFTYHYLLYSPGFTSFKIGDVNGDGFPDLVLYNSVNANGYLLIGDGAGNFPTGFSLFFGPGMDFVELRDFSGDGKQDVLLYRTADGTSFTGISNGSGFSYTYNYFGPGRIIGR